MRYLDLRAVRRALVEDGFKGRSYLCSSEGLSKLNATLGCDTSPGASNVGLVRLLSSGGNLSRPVQQVCAARLIGLGWQQDALPQCTVAVHCG